MLAVFGSIIGFLGSALPHILTFLKEKSDKSHELKIMDKQIELQRLTGSQALNEIEVSSAALQNQAVYQFANRPSNIPWVEGLIQSVRPTITYAFFALYAFIKISIIVHFTGNDTAVLNAMKTSMHVIWDEQTQFIFSVIVSFWFGNRGFEKRKI